MNSKCAYWVFSKKWIRALIYTRLFLKVKSSVTKVWIGLFSLYVLFSRCRSCDNTPENCFFQISSYSRVYVCIIYEKKTGAYSPGTSIQANEVYWWKVFTWRHGGHIGVPKTIKRRPYWCSKNNQTAAMLVFQTNPVGVELFFYVNTFFCSNKFA